MLKIIAALLLSLSSLQAQVPKPLITTKNVELYHLRTGHYFLLYKGKTILSTKRKEEVIEKLNDKSLLLRDRETKRIKTIMKFD